MQVLAGGSVPQSQLDMEDLGEDKIAIIAKSH